MIDTVCSALLNVFRGAKQAENCWPERQQRLCYGSLCVAGMTSTPSLFRAFCLALCLVPGSNGNQKGHVGRSKSSALMTLAPRQTDSAHPTRPHRRTPSLCRVSSESSHLAILCDFPLRKQPNHFLVDTLISWQPVSCQFQHLNIPVCISANIGGLIVSNRSQGRHASNALRGERSRCQSNKLRWGGEKKNNGSNVMIPNDMMSQDVIRHLVRRSFILG